MADILGKAPCRVCGGVVAYKENRAHKVYYACSGDYDAKACGSRLTFGATHSENLKRQFAAPPEPVAATNDNNPEKGKSNERQSATGTYLDYVA